MDRKVRELCRPIGRPGFAYDFSVETQEKIDPNDLYSLIGSDVYASLRSAPLDGVKMTVTDVSGKKIYGTKTWGQGKIEIDLSDLSAIEWSETVKKRIIFNEPR